MDLCPHRHQLHRDEFSQTASLVASQTTTTKGIKTVPDRMDCGLDDQGSFLTTGAEMHGSFFIEAGMAAAENGWSWSNQHEDA